MSMLLPDTMAGSPPDLQRMSAFVVQETSALNDERYSDWLGLLTDDFEYRMPAPCPPEDSSLPRYAEDAMLAWESYSSLLVRLKERLVSEFAWSDRPPAFEHRHVTSIQLSTKASRDIADNEMVVRSNVICVRSRVTEGTHWTSATREDIVRDVAGGLKLAERLVYIHEVQPSLSAIAMIY